MAKEEELKKESYFKIKWLYRCFWISRQAFYQKINGRKKQKSANEMLVKMVIDNRAEINQPTKDRKLYQLLKDKMKQQKIKIKRDNFFDFLWAHTLLKNKQHNFTQTTNSNHILRKFKNLIQNKIPNQPEELWVSILLISD